MSVVRVYFTSPEASERQREAFRDVVEEAYELKARAYGVMLKAIDGGTSLLGRFRPKALHDREVRTADLVVAVLWKGWEDGGSATRFEEDVARARQEETDLWLYAQDLADEELARPDTALRRVLDFRDAIERQALPCYAFRDDADWQEQLLDHLMRWLDDLPLDMPPGPVSAGAIDERLTALGEAASAEAVRQIQEAWACAAAGRRTRAAVHFARAKVEAAEPAVALEYARFLAERGALGRAASLLDQIADASPALDAQVAAVHGVLGSAYEQHGALDDAKRHFRAALAINQHRDAPARLAADYGSLGNVYWMQGQLGKAEYAYREALTINERLGNDEGLAADYSNLGNVYGVWGRLDEAERMYRTALDINGRLGRRANMANQYGNLGILYRVQDRLDAAEAAYRKALAIHGERGDQAGLAEDYSNLGNVYQERGDLDDAEAMYRKALTFYEALRAREGMANQYGNLGVLLQSRNHFDDAEAMYRKALAIFESLGDFMPMEQVKAWISDLEAQRVATG